MSVSDMDIDSPFTHSGSYQNPRNSVNMNTFTYSGNERNAVHKAKLLLVKLNYTFMLNPNCDDRYKVCTAMNCLRGPALTWFAFKYENQVPSWGEFLKAFIAEYCPTDEFETRQTASKYNACIQGNSSLEHYIRTFEELRSMLPLEYENEDATRDRFIQGLKPVLRSRVYQHRPESLSEAKFLCRDMDRGFYSRPSMPYKPRTSDHRGEPMDVDMIRRKFSPDQYQSRPPYEDNKRRGYRTSFNNSRATTSNGQRSSFQSFKRYFPSEQSNKPF